MMNLPSAGGACRLISEKKEHTFVIFIPGWKYPKPIEMLFIILTFPKEASTQQRCFLHRA